MGLPQWRGRVECHSEFRNKILAHKGTNIELQKVVPVHYHDFVQVLSELDEKLDVIEEMIDEPQSFVSKISSRLSEKNYFLDELDLILSCDCNALTTN